MGKILYDVFISYKRKDGSELATLFSHILEKAKYRPFMDVDELKVGEFAVELEKAISSSEVFLLMLTRCCFDTITNDDDFVRIELETALRLEKPIVVVSLVKDRIIEKLEKSDNEIHCRLREFNIFEYLHTHRKVTFEKLFETIKACRTARRSIDISFNKMLGNLDGHRAALTDKAQGVSVAISKNISTGAIFRKFRKDGKDSIAHTLCDCGAELETGAKFCTECGEPVIDAAPMHDADMPVEGMDEPINEDDTGTIICVCGVEVSKGANFCLECGTPASTPASDQSNSQAADAQSQESKHKIRSIYRVQCSRDIESLKSLAESTAQNEGFVNKIYHGEQVWKKGTGLATAMQHLKFECTQTELIIYAWVQMGVGDIGGKEMNLDGVVGIIPKRMLAKTVERIIKSIKEIPG